MTSRLFVFFIFWPLCALTFPDQAAAQHCTVPGSHAQIQEAVDDLACEEIALSAGTYDESVVVARTLILRGPQGLFASTVIQGVFRASGESTEVTLRDLTVRNSCESAFEVVEGAVVDALDVEILADEAAPCADELFRDGFESGDTAAWS